MLLFKDWCFVVDVVDVGDDDGRRRLLRHAAVFDDQVKR